MALKFGSIGIVTRDMAASLAFYRTLGMDIPARADNASHVEVTLKGGVVIVWDSVKIITGFDPNYTFPTGGHHISLAFDQGTPEGVDQAHAKLVAAGYPAHIDPWDAFWGQRYTVFLDPDGNSIDLYASLTTDPTDAA
ncbi:VOC family protein [Lysinibacter sp. HNR]|uniref:VOC family protein n=1 Tax=Lysinibacter sp. HNR TaxID=3031408 RepID=UPI00243542D4|nr:VOC family protein [Lysinibacter sp. HNR]WGD36250.1 VOC family protein [Lysinibacter sp. HNR]